MLGENRLDCLEFQSTLSVRRATDSHRVARATDGISIHALRKESDLVALISL